MQLLHTPSGVLFGLDGEMSGGPAPLLFQFAGTITDALTISHFCRTSDLLIARGWRAVSLDLPAHGSEVREGEIDGNTGAWRKRIEDGEDLMGDFIRRCSAVLDYCLEQGIADPEHIAAAGCSRGAYSALHFAAGDGRPRWIGAIAPLTILTATREFSGTEYNANVRALAVHRLVDKLVGKSVWVCIGNDDLRVSTDATIDFTRRLVEANKCRGLAADIELHVPNYDGHMSTPADHDALAGWLYAKANDQAPAGYGTLSLP